jgi:hypothetical protein
MSGECSNVYDIDRLPWAQVYSMDAYKMGSWDHVCKDKPVYKIVKTKDFNRCKTNPVWASATPATHSCEFGKGNCKDFMHVMITLYYYLPNGSVFNEFVF